MRILIATATAGAGHIQAAQALAEAWKKLRAQDSIRTIDILDFTPKLYKKLYAEGYLQFVKHAPEIYGYTFDISDSLERKQKTEALRKIISRLTAKKFAVYVRRYKPDILLCPHFLPIEVLNDLKEDIGARLPYIVCVITDFHAHAFWLEPGIDLYCVGSDKTKRDLVTNGVSPRKVAVTGIPVSARFAMKINRNRIRQNLKLYSRIPTVLVLSGGFGVGPIAEILDQLDRLNKSIQILVVTGRNERLKRELQGRTAKQPTKVFGFVKNMHELMAVSNLIITKAGGLTTSEALASGRPMVIVNPIPGQESANTKVLVKAKAATKISDVSLLARYMEMLLDSPKLSQMARSSKSLGKPRAAIQICRETLRRSSGSKAFKNVRRPGSKQILSRSIGFKKI